MYLRNLGALHTVSCSGIFITQPIVNKNGATFRVFGLSQDI